MLWVHGPVTRATQTHMVHADVAKNANVSRQKDRQDGNRESGGARARPGGGMVGPRTDSKVLTTCA